SSTRIPGTSGFTATGLTVRLAVSLLTPLSFRAGTGGRLGLQPGVHLRDGHRALAHGRCDPFDGSTAHVADREHAGQAGRQRDRCALERPASTAPAHHVGPRADEAPLVPNQAVAEPFGVRV